MILSGKTTEESLEMGFPGNSRVGFYVRVSSELAWQEVRSSPLFWICGDPEGLGASAKAICELMGRAVHCIQDIFQLSVHSPFHHESAWLPVICVGDLSTLTHLWGSSEHASLVQ